MTLHPNMRWFTGTPRNFCGSDAFFARESGLTCRGFQSLGIESGSILLAPHKEGQLSDVIRATREQMENPAWWASLKIDGLIFYTWGNSKFLRMVQAAVKAGVRVAQVTDSQGILSPLSDFRAHIQAEHAHHWYAPAWKRYLRTLLKLPITLTVRIPCRDLLMARTIAASDYFFAPTPCAAERFEKLVRRLQGPAAAQRVRFMPIPVNFHFTYSPEIPKLDEVVAVGRWDSTQKRTPLLTATIAMALAQRPSTRYRIFGQTTPELVGWHHQLPPALKTRVVLEGLVSNSDLATAYQQARVMLVSAAYEGCHNSSAEAICCGATVVACRSPFLGALEWHASKNSGRLAERATPDSLAQTLLEELAAWDRSVRNPLAHSEAWTSELHPDRVAMRILELFSQTPPLAKS